MPNTYSKVTGVLKARRVEASETDAASTPIFCRRSLHAQHHIASVAASQLPTAERLPTGNGCTC